MCENVKGAFFFLSFDLLFRATKSKGSKTEKWENEPLEYYLILLSDKDLNLKHSFLDPPT